MALPNPQVFVGFDLTDTGVGPFAVLDDEERGILDGPNYVLAGTIFINVTERVRKISIGRGKPRDFGNFTTGAANVEFNNHDRAFDPLYTGSPYYGNIVPRREIIITTEGVTQFKGWIEDWDLNYLPSGDSVVTAKAIDALATFAQQALPASTPTTQLSGARITAILNSTAVDWPVSQRSIATGQELVGNYAIEANTNALSYLQNITTAEIGELYMSRDGLLTFKDRYKSPAGTAAVVFGANDIPFANLQVIYGSELLYNDISVSRQDGGTVTVTNIESQNLYGNRNFDLPNLQVSSDTQLPNIALVFATQYSEPEYRFESLDVTVQKLTPEQQAKVLALDLSSVVKITFTPNGIGDAIERFVEVIRVDHFITPSSHMMTFGFAATTNNYFRLSDAAFGRLSAGNSLAW
jgi:hypothetical protein